MMARQHISRKGNFDAGHRVMNEAMKCFNLHGHTYLFELAFGFNSVAPIGYAIDFKEIKRVGSQWIDDLLDHGMILNPTDETVIKTVEGLGGKLWLMSLNGAGQYCNPTVENIAREVFMAMQILFDQGRSEGGYGLQIDEVVIWETPNCATRCRSDSISSVERNNFHNARFDQIDQYRIRKGELEYDDRL